MMFFDTSCRRPRKRQQNQMSDWDMGDLRDSGLFRALAVGALIYLGAKTINRITED